MRIARLIPLLALALGGAVHAQTAYVETPLGAGLIAPGAARIETLDLNADLDADLDADLLVLRRTGNAGQVELWLQQPDSPGGFRLGQTLQITAPVVDVLAHDLDFDGRRDIVVATSDPQDSLLVFMNHPGQPLQRAPQRFALPGIHALHRAFGTLSAGAVVVTFANGSPFRLLNWNDVDGLALQPQQFDHPGGAQVVLPIYYGDFSEPPALLSLGAHPQRLWRKVGEAYVASELPGIDVDVHKALALEVNGGFNDGLVTATASGQVDVWAAQPSDDPLAPPADYAKHSTLAPADPARPVLAMARMSLSAPPDEYQLAVSRRAADGVGESTHVYRVQGSSGTFVDDGDFAGGLSLASNLTVAFAGDSQQGIRSYTVGDPLPGTPEVSLGNLPAFGYQLPNYDDAAYVDVPVVTDRPVATPIDVQLQTGGLDARPAHFFRGARFSTVRVTAFGKPRSGYVARLFPPVDASYTVTSTGGKLVTIEVHDYEPVPVASFCAANCLFPFGGCGTGGSAAGDEDEGEPGEGGRSPAEVDINLQTLRDFRDQVLASSAAGREYIALYERFGFEFVAVGVAHPWFYSDLLEAGELWMPAFESLVHGDGSAVIDATMLDAMDRVFDFYRSHGSAALRLAFAEHLPLIVPRDFEGRTIGELAQHWAQLPPRLILDDGFEDPAE